MSTSNDVMNGAPQCVADIVRGLATRDFALIAANLAADATWTQVGRTDRFPFGGTKPKGEFVEGITMSLSGMDAFSFKPLRWAQNGDTVFVEAAATGQGPGAATYQNHYLMRFLTRDGIVTQCLEHNDPFEALVYVDQLTGAA